MDLIRKMSSGLRSSQELSAAVEQSKKEDSVLPSGASSDKDDADVFEDAASAQQGQQNSDSGPDEGQQRGESSGNEQQQQEQQQQQEGTRIRAPPQMSDEFDAYDDDDDDAAGEEEEDEDLDEEDGGGSYGSGESYDSALERMAGSSEANFDASSSPRIASPVGSFLPGPAVVDGEEGSSVLNVSQQGALMRLNQLRTGEASLDPSVLDSSAEEFKSIVGDLAAKEEKSVDEPSFASILDALLPLVEDRANGHAKKEEGDDDEAGKGKSENEGNAEASSVGGDSEVQGSQGSMPRAQLSAEDDDNDDDFDADDKADEGDSKLDLEENGDEKKVSSQASIKAPASEDEVSIDDKGSEPTTGKIDEKSEPAKGEVQEAEEAEEEEEEEEEETGGDAQFSTERSLPEEFKPTGREGVDEEFTPTGREGVDEDEVDDEYGEDEEEYEGEVDEDEGDADFDELANAADSAAAVSQSEPPLRGGSAAPSLPARPTRTVRSSLPSLDPAPRTSQVARGAGSVATQPPDVGSQANGGGDVADGNEETREKLQAIRVKFLRLALRLGQPAHNVVVAQVLYRLGLAEQLRGGRSSRNSSFSFDRANAIAEDQEASGPEELDFSCTIMMLGKTGVGKSATINSIFDEAKTGTNAYSPSTKKVQVITGQVHGIKVRVIDTPGLLPSVQDQRHNEKIMASVKSFIKKQPPDIVLFFDRLDMQSRDLGDLPLLRTITETFGAAVWFNAIVVLTHASSAPPDGSNGLPLSYEMFVAQRSHVVQQTIRQAAGDMRLMNPVSLVENHAACRVNRSGDRVLPNGQVWKPQLLLLCFASKILAEANALLKLQDSTPGRPFGSRSRVPPLPFLLSSLLQSRAQLKLPDEQMGDEDESDEDMDSESDSDADEDYDQLPPFRRLAREEIAELDDDTRGSYYEELAERERLFQKKQWREELRRRREMKRRMAEAPMDQSQFVDEGAEEELARSAAVPVPMPDMVLPPSFDSESPSHRYRYLESANQWLVRPVLETHGWDHDNGYDGMSVEKMFVVRQNIPASISGQVTKDKKEANLNMECAASLKHGEGKVTLAGLDVQTVGKDMGYTIRSETRFSNFKGNKTTGGLAVTLLGDTISAGMKIEDRLIVGKRLKLVVNGGAITGGGDVAYGGSLEATLRDKEYPLSRTLSTLGVSVMDWHGDLAIGANLQSQFIVGKSMMVGRANLNNRGAGQISIRASSSEQMQMTLIGLLPVIRAIANRLLFGSQPQQ